ncbi:helix-turn-helix domain-containing protein [Arenibaculum sp.]|jgi:transcriptional regulator with XRE-family HTH domain|uniref:helix-turn-helix domain-containing protein n=1 Tax=Arenibaculum sp. TaxID=2865862 RepID=UPI002E150998|nr:helix-turn-helix domain-containing protein [Arenibaculum sp.]
MKDFAQRLARRHAQLGLVGKATAERAGVTYQRFTKLLNGEIKSLPDPDELVRLCKALALTPHQALGLDPIPGLDDGIELPERAVLQARIRAALSAMDEPRFDQARRLLDGLDRQGPEKPANPESA